MHLLSWYYLLSPKEAQKASRKPTGSYKKFQGRNTEIISLLFLDKLKMSKRIKSKQTGRFFDKNGPDFWYFVDLFRVI